MGDLKSNIIKLNIRTESTFMVRTDSQDHQHVAMALRSVGISCKVLSVTNEMHFPLCIYGPNTYFTVSTNHTDRRHVSLVSR